MEQVKKLLEAIQEGESGVNADTVLAIKDEYEQYEHKIEELQGKIDAEKQAHEDTMLKYGRLKVEYSTLTERLDAQAARNPNTQKSTGNALKDALMARKR